jgi:RNA polymerase sigma factor (sigma-70 family)
MRLPLWKRKSMLTEAIAQEIPENVPGHVNDTTRRDAFIRLMDQFEPALRRLTGAYAAQPADREDLFQEIAVALWQAIPKFRGDASERTWLYRIAHNVAITHSTRRRSRGGREEAIAEGADFPSAAINSEQEVLRAEKRSLLLAAIRELPAADRQLVLLHLEGLSYAQIEEISGFSQSAVASRLSRLRDRIRDRINAAGKEPR